MARGGVNKALVQKARLALLARGEHPSIDSVRIEMGNTGSKTTIHRYLKELDQVEVTPPELNQELAELVARLAERLQEQGQERIDSAQAIYVAAREKIEQELKDAHRQIAEQSKRLALLTADNENQAATLLRCEQALHGEQTSNARLGQANQDLESRLTDKDQQIQSLEEKHRHARDALEHYRNSIKEQREQEQRRHEGQLQQIQMELRQTQQSLSMRQEELTQLNRDNERLLAESRSVTRELGSQKDLLGRTTEQVAATREQFQHSQTQCALFEERLNAALCENAELKQHLIDTRQQNRMLELLLTKKELALENLREPGEKSKPKKAQTRTKPQPDK